MLFGSRTIFLIGTLVIALLGWFVFEFSPAPARLASAHWQLNGLSELSGCATCHHDDGLANGCLDCHREIANQLTDGRGFHPFLMKDRLLKGQPPHCTPCHAEHKGETAVLTTEASWGAQVQRAFKHPHVEFALRGKHERLECESCHKEKLAQTFTLPSHPDHPRVKTFLGLKQECVTCHKDVHSGGMTGPCESCHGQEQFRPPQHFDHAKHFPLDGGHERLACATCHVMPQPDTPKQPAPFPFAHTRGKTCGECHPTPHRAKLEGKCEDCHPGSEPKWVSAMSVLTREKHAWTGFRLDAPHDGVACQGCHPPQLPFQERHPDPASPSYRRKETTCEGCHKDAHNGQFLDRHQHCSDCHSRHGFLPTAFSREAHTAIYPLEGGHAAVACSACHLRDAKTQVRTFAGASKECRVCHANPHGEQFPEEMAKDDCSGCHNAASGSWQVKPFDHTARAGYVLDGAHSRAQCNACHVETSWSISAPAGRVRQYEGTPRQCGACHKDPHRGQFQDRGDSDCATCHVSRWDWKNVSFDHDRQSRFPLTGSHSGVACSRCHVPVKLPDGNRTILYKPIGTECRTCHEVSTHSPEKTRR